MASQLDSCEGFVHVSLSDFKMNRLLTEMYYNPALLEPYKHYYADNRYSEIPQRWGDENLCGQRVLVFRKVLDKTRIARLLLSVCFIGITLGTVIGAYFRRGDVGIAIITGVFTLAAFLQGMAAWFRCH